MCLIQVLQWKVLVKWRVYVIKEYIVSMYMPITHRISGILDMFGYL